MGHNNTYLGIFLTLAAACGEADSEPFLRADGGDASRDGAVASPRDAGPPERDAGAAPRDGGAPRDAGEGVSDPFDPASAAEAMARAFCAHRARCSPSFNAYLRHDEAACTAQASLTTRPLTTLYAQMIEAERLRFDRVEFDACIDAYATVDCVEDSPPTCYAAFVGQRATGESCAYAQECADGWCSASFGTCGQCERAAVVGESCRFSLCRDDLLCVRAGNDNVCVEATAQVGEPCGTTVSGLCAGRLDCVGPSGSRVCVVPGELGDACDLTRTTIADCDAPRGLTCLDGTCEAIAWGGVGESCVEPAMCDSTAACNGSTMRCVEPPGLGEPCDGVCQPGLYCRAGDTCRPLLPRGSTCASDDDCELGLWCVSGTCDELVYPACR